MATVKEFPANLAKHLPGRKYDRQFFFVMTILLLAVVVIGFAPTYYYYCVIRIHAGSMGTVAEIGRGVLRSDGEGWQWIEDYAVLCAGAAPRGV